MELKKNLSKLDVFCISTGAMLSGLFLLPGHAFAQAGPAVLISYVIAGLLAFTGLLSQAELVSAMPKAGGTYFYITRSMGSAVGTVYGLITWFSLALKTAYELFFMGVLIATLTKLDFGAATPNLIASVLCLLFVTINLIGIKEAGKLQVLLVLLLLAALFLFCYKAFPSLDAQNFNPFLTHPREAIVATAGYVFISFGGLLKVASVAEEVKNPGRVIPRSMTLSLVIICFIYLTVVFMIIAVVPADKLKGSDAPLSTAAELFLGPSGATLFIIATLMAVFTSANAGVMTASRYPLALARDEMLPVVFGKISHRFNTPHIAILLTGAVIILACFVNIDVLIKAASSVLILTYIFSSLAVVILRESRIQNYQPQFKPAGYPWLQLIGIVGFIIILYVIGVEALLMTCFLIVLGFLLYWTYGRKKAKREFALLHLIERITAREITSHHLETELKDIVHQRDDILKDRFDHLIEQCPVVDVDSATDHKDFFHQAAQAMAEHLAIDADALSRLFVQREQESSTVLSPFLAIPHIVVDGEKHFDILLARCKEGFHFSEKAPQVHTVFMLVGTRDERPFHLLSLTAIAQIVQDDDFERRWVAAKTPQALRDIVLLSKRQRQT